MTVLAEIGLGLIDKITKYFPSEEEKAKAKVALVEAEQRGELDDLKTRLSAILAEAGSTDPWTSRARPSFMYVIYAMLLSAIPAGIAHAIDPTFMGNVIAGFTLWLRAIPNELYALFGAGYLGYTGFRSWDKKNGV